jgi:hypothetical protein
MVMTKPFIHHTIGIMEYWKVGFSKYLFSLSMKTFPTEHASIFPDPIIPGFQNSSIPIEALLQRF